MKKTYIELPLSSEDKSKLRLQLIPIFIFPIFVIIIFVLIFTYVLPDTSDLMGGETFNYAFIAVGAIFAAIIIYSFWTIVTDIRRGIKYRIEGIVMDKKMNISTHTTGSSGARNSGKTRTKRSYFVTIGEEEFSMKNSEYNMLQTGDEVVMEISPKAKRTLRLEVLKREEVQVHSSTKMGSTSLQNTGLIKLTEQDRVRLQQRFKGQLVRRTLFLGVPLFIVVSLASSGMASLLIFLFPIPIIAILQLYKLLKMVIQFMNSRDVDTKMGQVVKVVDKTTITSNRNATKYLVKTDGQLLNLPKEAYEELSKGEHVIVFTFDKQKKPFQIVTNEDNPYYLV